MFEEVGGIPLHPMLVHAAVVFIPLLVLGAAVYALVPKMRARVVWPVAALAVAAPLAALFAKISGDQFRQRLIDKKILTPGSALFDRVDDHRALGNITLWFTLALGFVTLLLIFLTNRRISVIPTWGTITLGAIVLALAVASGYYVYWTGDYGAKAVWEGF